MAKFCIYERHGGVCIKTGCHCKHVCPYEELEEFTQVVQCKDCKFATGNEVDYICKNIWSPRWGIFVNPNFFCFCGVKKDGDGNG